MIRPEGTNILLGDLTRLHLLYTDISSYYLAVSALVACTSCGAAIRRRTWGCSFWRTASDCPPRLNHPRPPPRTCLYRGSGSPYKNTVSNLSVTLESFQSSIISISPSSNFFKFRYCTTSNFGLTLIVVVVCPETCLTGS